MFPPICSIQPKWFIGRNPTETDRREKAPTIIFSKTLRTIISKVTFQEITTIIIISKTTGYPHIPVRQRKKQTSRISRQIIAHIINQQTTHAMIPKHTIIINSCFKISGSIYLFASFRIAQPLRPLIGIQAIQHISIIDFIIHTHRIIVRCIFAGLYKISISVCTE